MRGIDNKEKAMKIGEVLKNKISQFEYVRDRKWGDSAGSSGEKETYQLKNEQGVIWCCYIEWVRSGSSEVNRCGILVCLPEKKPTKSIGPVAEITAPYYFSRGFQGRPYEEGNIIELRHYGRFTIGRAGLKREAFFDYIAKNAPDEICYDEGNKPYIKILELKDFDIGLETFKNRIIEYTYLVKNFKDNCRKLSISNTNVGGLI